VKAASEPASPTTTGPTGNLQLPTFNLKPTPRKLSYKEKRELDELESRIESAEARASQIEAEIARAASDYVRLQALTVELESLKSQLDCDVERWAELAQHSDSSK
jgi:ATP-binding cassette subfamily F protein uup